MSWMMINYQNNMNFNLFIMNKINNMFNNIMFMIMFMIIFFLISNINNKYMNKSFFENQTLEFMWTILPIILIMFIMFNSIITLMLNNENKFNILNIKILSNQWFWFYEYMNFNIKFNSYLFYNKNFHFNFFETDNNLILPSNFQINLIISSLDVIHSWTIPSMNIKIDSIPNQINNKILFINKNSISYGQCSEICGINHSFMPIKIESIPMFYFIKWIN